MIDAFRNEIPALRRVVNGQSAVFLDGPAGTQMPNFVIEAISDYYKKSNANTHGAFINSRETDEIMDKTRKNLAVFLGAPGPGCISFGQNMTTLTFSLANALGKELMPGEEVLITQLDHEANRGPWLSLRQKGIIVREVKVKENGTLDYLDLEHKINEKTRLLAMGMASNLTGAINDAKIARKLTYDVGAWLLLDAVHYAPHFLIDVEEIGCDFLLCSAYKFYGPHVGILYSKPGLLDRLPTERLRTSAQTAPFSIETGTLNHAAIAGVNAAVEFLASFSQASSLREKLKETMVEIGKYESVLFKKLYQGILNTGKATIVGPGMDAGQRAPTISFTWQGLRPEDLCSKLAENMIYAWDGHFYAIRVMEVLGLLEAGGVTRMGISAYINEGDINRTIEVLSDL